MSEIDELVQYIIIRSDLGMGKGKMVAQGCHVSILAYIQSRVFEKWKSWCDQWMNNNHGKNPAYMKKIVVKVDSEEELKRLQNETSKMDLPMSWIHDAGRTQIKPNTLTAICVGPCPQSFIKPLVKNLKLL